MDQINLKPLISSNMHLAYIYKTTKRSIQCCNEYLDKAISTHHQVLQSLNSISIHSSDSNNMNETNHASVQQKQEAHALWGSAGRTAIWARWPVKLGQIDLLVVICPTATEYSMEQVIKPVEFLDRFSPKLADTRTKVKTSSFGLTLHYPSSILPPKPNCLAKRSRVLKIHADINNPMSALHVCKSPKFPHPIGNRDRGTRWWRQILDWK